MHSIYSFTCEALREHVSKRYQAVQIFDWLYRKGVSSFDEMLNLSHDLRHELSSRYSLSSLTLRGTKEAEETIKYLWELRDGSLVESVLICSGDRRTVCVSSQVGCPARCAFCASGKEGLFRSLSTGEIVEQVVQIDRVLKSRGERVSHVVYMGMGEPLENYEAVLASIRILSAPEGLHLSQRRITVSTVGVVEGILRFAQEGLQVPLVLSLHASNQHLRKKIIPYARKYPLEMILDAMDTYYLATKRDLTFEYTLLKGINDSPECARELITLLKGKPCTVNLIPYNPIAGLRLERPDHEAIHAFRTLLDQGGLRTTWRYTKGDDIAAACGQLALQKKRSLPLSSESTLI